MRSLRTLEEHVRTFSTKAQYLESSLTYDGVNMERIAALTELHGKFDSLMNEITENYQEIGGPMSSSTPDQSIIPPMKTKQQKAKRKLTFETDKAREHDVAVRVVGPGGGEPGGGDPGGEEPGGGGPQEHAHIILPWIQKIEDKIAQSNVNFTPDKFVVPQPGKSFQSAILQQLKRPEILPLIEHLDLTRLLSSPESFMQELCLYMKTKKTFDDFGSDVSYPSDGYDWNYYCEDILEPNRPTDVVIQCCCEFLNLDITILDTSRGTVEAPFQRFKGARKGLSEQIVIGKHDAEEAFFVSLLPKQKTASIPNKKSMRPPSKPGDVPVTVSDNLSNISPARENRSNIHTVVAEPDKHSVMTSEVDPGLAQVKTVAVQWENYQTIPEDENTCYVLDPVPCRENRVLPDKPTSLYKWSGASNSRPSNPRNRYIQKLYIEHLLKSIINLYFDMFNTLCFYSTYISATGV